MAKPKNLKNKTKTQSLIPTSKRLFAKASEVLVGGVNSPVRAFKSVGGTPLFFKKARGPFLYDADNHRYLDYINSWGPIILGHAHPQVVGAVRSSLSKGFSFGAPHELEAELALLIRDAFPVMEKLRLVNSGTEATLSAIRLARGYTKRDKIVKFSGCYHGHGDSFLIKAGSGALTLGLPDSPGVTKATAGDTLIAEYNDIDSVEQLFKRFGEQIASVIIEPVGGNMGLVPAKKDFLQKLRTLSRKYGALLIFDEVMTGFRLAWGGAQERYGVKPDLVCLGKVVGGGFPVAAYGGSKKIMHTLAPEGPVYQAGTLSGHPLGMVSGFATLSLLKKNRVKYYHKLEQAGNYLVDVLTNSIHKNGYPITINKVGSMFTLFFTPTKVSSFKDAVKSDTKKYGRFFHALLKEGIYFPPSQFESAFISLAHEQRHLEKTARAIQKAWATLY